MGLRAPKGPNQPMVGTDSLNLYFGPTDTNVMSEEQQLKQMLEAQMVKGIEEQRQNQEMQRAMLEKSLAQDVQPDLSAAWGLVKAAGGDASAASLSPKNLNQDVMALQKELQRTTAGITDDEINLLRAKLQNTQAESEARKANQYLTTKDYDAFKNVKVAFDKPREDLNSFYQSFDVMKNAIGTGDMYAIQNALSNFARLAGEKGVLTDQDIVRVVPSNLKMETAKALAFLRSDPTYQAPKEVLEAVGAAADRLREAAELKYKGQLAQQKEAFEQGPLSFPKYANQLYSAGEKAIRPKDVQAAQSDQMGLNINKDAIKAEIERRKNERAKGNKK